MSKYRVLVEGLSNNYGGTEAVIENVNRAVGDFVSFDYLVDSPLTSHLDLLSEENRQIVLPARSKNPFRYYSRLRQVFKRSDTIYDAVWVNKNNFGNLAVINAAKSAGVRRRILHFHSLEPSKRSFYQHLIDIYNYKTVLENVTDYWVCSTSVGEKYFPNRNYVVVPNAIDFDSYRYSASDRQAVRNGLGLNDSFVLGYVGRLEERKNPGFLLEVLRELLPVCCNSRLLIIGDGPLKNALAARAKELDVSESVMFLGAQDNPSAFLSAFDVFLFPSLNEGLGIAAIEAQVNGLHCLVSEFVPEDVKVSDSIEFLPLDAARWVSSISAINSRRTLLLPNSEQFDLGKQGVFLCNLFLTGDY